MRFAPLVPKPKPDPNGKRKIQRKPSRPSWTFATTETNHADQPREHGDTQLSLIDSRPEKLARITQTSPAKDPPRIFTKLEVGDVDDPLEREADEIADEVMQMPKPTAGASVPGPDVVGSGERASCESGAQMAPPTLADVVVRRACATCTAEDDEIYRVCASCSAEDDELLRTCESCDSEDDEIRREAGAGSRGGRTSDEFANRVRVQIRRGGAPLSSGARDFLEPRLGVGLDGVRLHSDSEAGLLARQINARAFTLGPDIFFAQGELRPHTHGGMRLLAHEVAHTLQGSGGRSVRPIVSNPESGAIRRASTIEFEEEAWNQTNQIVDDLGNIRKSDPLGYQFIQGAKNHLGVSFTRKRNKLTFDSVDKTARENFLANFTSAVTMRQTIVEGDTTDTRDVVIDNAYAATVFDTAVELVSKKSFDVRIDKGPFAPAAEAKKAVVKVNDDNIDINPNLYGKYYMHEGTARAYDGFWILLHEMFHLAGAERYTTLAQARSRSVKEVTKDGSAGELVQESDNSASWDSDVPGQTAGAKAPPGSYGNPGPIVSLVNILRHGSGLPIRYNYGDQASSSVVISFLHFDSTTGSWSQPQEGIIRQHATSNREERKIASDLVDYNNALRDDDLWTNRLRKSKIEISLSSRGHFEFDMNSAENDNSGVISRSIRTKLVSGDSTLDIDANWGTAVAGKVQVNGTDQDFEWPIIEIGRANLNMRLGGEAWCSMLGQLESPQPFYNASPWDETYFTDRQHLEGTLSGICTDSPLDTSRGTWRIMLGPPSTWHIKKPEE